MRVFLVGTEEAPSDRPPHPHLSSELTDFVQVLVERSLLSETNYQRFTDLLREAKADQASNTQYKGMQSTTNRMRIHKCPDILLVPVTAPGYIS